MQAKELPLWEVGVGMAGVHAPHYLGAEQNTNIFTPTPYLIYRGDKFQYSDKGFRGLFFKGENWETDVSANFVFPVDSDDNSLRRGMPDINPILELGPKLIYTTYRSTDQRSALKLVLPLRAAVSWDDYKSTYRGLSFSPKISFEYDTDKMGIDFGAGPIFYNQRYQQYFYSVKNQYVTANRTFYDASGGYAGMRYSASFSRHFNQWFLGGYITYYDIHGSKNNDSSLVGQDGNLSAGFIVAWKFRTGS